MHEMKPMETHSSQPSKLVHATSNRNRKFCKISHLHSKLRKNSIWCAYISDDRRNVKKAPGHKIVGKLSITTLGMAWHSVYAKLNIRLLFE